MAKKELKLRAFVSPTETVVVSAYDKDGKAQACTLAFYMVSSHVPPCVTIAINATLKRKTLKAILEQDAFVLGFPSVNQVKEADYLGVESGYHADKLKNIGFHTSEAEKVHAPIIDEILLSLECQVVHKATVGSHMQITGEVKKIVADESILNEQGKVVLEKLNPLIYDEEQFRYLKVGGNVSEAFKPGAAMKKSFIDKWYPVTSKYNHSYWWKFHRWKAQKSNDAFLKAMEDDKFVIYKGLNVEEYMKELRENDRF